MCDWEGTPAHIVYEHPYIIAIDPYFIEIRHVDTVSNIRTQISKEKKRDQHAHRVNSFKSSLVKIFA